MNINVIANEIRKLANRLFEDYSSIIVPQWVCKTLNDLQVLHNKVGQAGYWYKCKSKFSIQNAEKASEWIQDNFRPTISYSKNIDNDTFIYISDPANFELEKRNILKKY